MPESQGAYLMFLRFWYFSPIPVFHAAGRPVPEHLFRLGTRQWPAVAFPKRIGRAENRSGSCRASSCSEE
ncbi:MAG: hypothetical protein IJ523_01800 [Succinivibrionaceae bacterium]|nr:hypothetical protein [Succinivibrionaceae bacterium]